MDQTSLPMAAMPLATLPVPSAVTEDHMAAARRLMVDGQVRPNKVYDPRLLAAMRRIPRERFLPPALAARAYADEDVPLGNGRALMEPMVIARLLELAAIRQGERVLVAACGVGYGAALIAACGGEVTAVEDDPALLAIAGPALAEQAPSVRLMAGAPAAGCPEGAPYDLLLIEGAVEEFPDALIRQVAPRSGRLVTVRHAGGRIGHGGLGEVSEIAGEPKISFRPVFDCATPVLPAMRRAAGFVF